MTASTKWWHKATIYEVYPASFKDSNADGIGDIPGIISKIPYLVSLGIDAVWLAACYKSSGIDMGYDVVNYRDIDPQYGTVADIDNLVAELRKQNIRLIMDLVVNHTSSEHDWFKESRLSEASKKRDWYIWRKGGKVKQPDGSVKLIPPNNWESVFKGSAWEYDKSTDEWYLRIFSKHQPDLNWDNPEVRQAVYGDMRFWLDKGVAGFRMDVINMISKPADLPDAPAKRSNSMLQNANDLFCNGPRVHEFLHEMNREVLSKYKDTMTVGEAVCTHDPETVKLFTNPDREELDMIYTYDFFGLDCGPGGKFSARDWKVLEFKKLVVKWQSELAFSRGCWQTLWLESHDSGRSVTRFGDRTPENRASVAKMLAMLQTTLSGTLFIYQGQELGMRNLDGAIPISEYPDVETKKTWDDILDARVDESRVGKQEIDMSDVVREVLVKARDHARAPLSWKAASPSDPHAGFSDASAGVKTWSPMNTDSTVCNIASQSDNPDSVLNFWIKRLQIRRKYPEVIVFGGFEPLVSTIDDGPILAYWRKPLPGMKKVEGKGTDGARDVLVVLNLSPKINAVFQLPMSGEGAEKKFFVLDCTTGDKLGGDGLVESGEVIYLDAYEGVVFGY